MATTITNAPLPPATHTSAAPTMTTTSILLPEANTTVPKRTRGRPPIQRTLGLNQSATNLSFAVVDSQEDDHYNTTAVAAVPQQPLAPDHVLNHIYRDDNHPSSLDSMDVDELSLQQSHQRFIYPVHDPKPNSGVMPFLPSAAVNPHEQPPSSSSELLSPSQLQLPLQSSFNEAQYSEFVDTMFEDLDNVSAQNVRHVHEPLASHTANFIVGHDVLPYFTKEDNVKCAICPEVLVGRPFMSVPKYDPVLGACRDMSEYMCSPACVARYNVIFHPFNYRRRQLFAHAFNMQIMGLKPEECGTIVPPVSRLNGRPEYSLSKDEYRLIGAGGDPRVLARIDQARLDRGGGDNHRHEENELRRTATQVIAPEMHVEMQSVAHFSAPLTMAVIRSGKSHLVAPTINLEGLKREGVALNPDLDAVTIPFVPPITMPKHVS